MQELSRKHGKRNKHVGVYNLCDEVRCRSWIVSLNILFVGVDSRILRTGVLRDRQWEARG